MNKIRYAEAGMDVKKLILAFLGKIWIVVLAAAIGAAAGAILYTGFHTVPVEEREYRAVSKLYLDFAADETGEVYQAYNGYTWNDLMATDSILDVTMQNLDAQYTREEVAAATRAEILSDLRLLTITITTGDPKRTDAILNATDRSLESLGDTAKEFTQIRTIQEGAAELVVADSRMAQAVCLGLVIGLTVAVLALLLLYILDDRITTPADLRQVTEVPFAGYREISVRPGQEEKGRAVRALCEDGEAALRFLQEKYKGIELVRVTPKEPFSEQQWKTLKAAPGAILCVPAGKVHAVYLETLLDQFTLRGCEVKALMITDADSRFLNRYYGTQSGIRRKKDKNTHGNGESL